MMDPLSLLLDERVRAFDSRYRVVSVSAQRAKQLLRGIRRSQTSKFTKETSMALEEALGGHVDYLVGQDARQAMREAKTVPTRLPEYPLSADAADNDGDMQRPLGAAPDDSTNGTAPASESGSDA